MAKVVLLSLISFSASVWAKDFHILRYKSNTLHSVQEHSVLLKKDKITVVRNTNALCGPDLEGSIGQFEKKSSKLDQSNFALIKQVANRLKNRGRSEKPQEIRDARFYIDEVDVTYESTKKKLVKSILEKTCDLKRWDKIQAANGKIVKSKSYLSFEFEIVNKDKRFKKNIPLSKSKC